MTNEPPAPDLDTPVTLLDYLFPLLRWRWMIFLVTAVLGLLGIATALSRAPTYTATAYFLPAGALGDQDELRALGGGGGRDWRNVRSASEIVNYYDVALKTRSLMETLLAQPFTSADHGEVPLARILVPDADIPPARAIKTLRDRIEVGSAGGKILKLAFTAGEPELSAAVVNALLEAYRLQPRDAQRATADVRFIKERITEVKTRLEEKEAEIADARGRALDMGQPDAMRRMAGLEREARLLERMYENLNAEYARAEIRMIQTQREVSGEVEILDPAEPPLERAGPNRVRIVLVFGFIGIVLSCGAAFVIEYFAGMRRVLGSHPFWLIFGQARRELLFMAVVTALALAAAILYRLRG